MSSIAQALIASARSEVVVGPLRFRVHRITSEELLEAGESSLLVANPPKAEGEGAAPVDPKAARRSARFMDAVVCAGLEAASADGESWQPIRATLDPKRENATAGVIFVGNLLPGAAAKLANEILKLSTDEGAAGARIASFLGS